MSYQNIIREDKTTRDFATKDIDYVDLSYFSSLERKQMRKYIRKKQLAKTKPILLFFIICTIFIPIVFMYNLNNFILKKFNNSFIEIPKDGSLLNEMEFKLANNIFLDSRYIDTANTDKPLMVSPPLSEKMPNLTYRLNRLAANYSGIRPGIFVWDYSTGKYVDIEANRAVPAASMIKIPVLLQLFKRAEKGLVDLRGIMSTEDHYIAEGSGGLQYLPLGTTLTYEKLAETMIRQSDNTATNMLLATLGGMNEVNWAIKDWGNEATRFSNWLPDIEGTNIMTPAEVGKMFYNIDNPEFLTIESRAAIVNILSKVDNRYLIRAGLPDNVEFLHKTGYIGKMLGDGGIVIFPNGRKYIVVIMVECKNNNTFTAKEFIIKAAKEIHSSISAGNF